MDEQCRYGHPDDVSPPHCGSLSLAHYPQGQIPTTDDQEGFDPILIEQPERVDELSNTLWCRRCISIVETGNQDAQYDIDPYQCPQ
jgi:hypothetical protein